MKRNDGGFTLIELIVVLTIGFVLFSMVVPAITGSKKAKFDECYEAYKDAIYCEMKVYNNY